jgi:hypothetical protein
MGKLSSAFEQAETSDAYLSLRRDKFHSRVGHSFPLASTFEELLFSNCKQANSRLFAQFFFTGQPIFLFHVKKTGFLSSKYYLSWFEGTVFFGFYRTFRF